MLNPRLPLKEKSLWRETSAPKERANTLAPLYHVAKKHILIIELDISLVRITYHNYWLKQAKHITYINSIGHKEHGTNITKAKSDNSLNTCI
jgi:hypothetical protein